MATNLPTLPPVERLSPRVIRILGDNPGKFTLQGTNTYLIGTGPSRLLIDTGQGLGAWRSSLSSLLASESCTISTTLLTHWHPDHVLGVPDLLSLCPSSHIHKYSPDPPTETYTQLPITNKQVFSIEGATLRAVHCPGHTHDHTAFLLEEEGALFTGDAVLGHGTAVFEDLVTYLRSLSELRTYCRPNGRAYPGHGAVIPDAAAKIEEYLRHRKIREEEVLRCLERVQERKAGEQRWTPAEVVKVVYKDVPESLHAPAEGSVRQVLGKLEGEGRVENIGDRWSIVGEKAAL